MSNYFLFILLFSTLCFSQDDFELTKQIDSLIVNNKNSRYGISEGSIKSESETITHNSNNATKVNGSGGFSTTTYIKYLDENYYISLSKEEKKNYKMKFEIIKSKNHTVINYKNCFSENI